MTEPKKLPPLEAAIAYDVSENDRVIIAAKGLPLTDQEAREAIRRCEMHDRLVEKLKAAYRLIKARESEDLDSADSAKCNAAMSEFEDAQSAWDKLEEGTAAILKENSHGA